MILERLEGAFEGFEQVVERILETSGGEFGPGQQARLVRFLVTRGYQSINPTSDPGSSNLLACWDRNWAI